MLEVRIRGGEPWKVAFGVWHARLVSLRIYRNLYKLFDSPTIALTSLNDGVWAIASEKYTKYVRRTRTMEYAGRSRDHSLLLYEQYFFFGNVSHRLGYHLTPSQRIYSSGKSAQRT